MPTTTASTRNLGRSWVTTAALLLVAPAAIVCTAARPALAQVLTSTQEAEAAGDYAFDVPHCDVSFTVIHLALSKVHGHFSKFSGSVKVAGTKLQDSTIDFRIETDSITTDNETRDKQLKSAAFFDCANYPAITFQSTRISKRKDKNLYAATGKLTIHGVSKTVVLPFTVVGPVVTEAKGKKTTHYGVEIALDINRRDYQIGMDEKISNAIVSDVVRVNIDLDLTKIDATKTDNTSAL